uniref:Torsin-1A C-terminal domain-containing protein n=1 Tax=Ciona intestinalis TaxID=7719 RepID=H2XLI1_CIOIN
MWIFFYLLPHCFAFLDPISMGVVVGTAATSALVMVAELSGLSSFRCKTNLMECCDKHNIKPNMTGLQHDLRTKLYGQHLVEKTVYRAVKHHLANPNPSKALVMSFHGWTGSGKNYVAQMIVKNLYRKNLESSFVHVFNAEVDFKHQQNVGVYKDQLQSWLHGNVSKCGRSIFIFDEIDHMPVGLVDALKPYMSNEPVVHGVDYRKTIFIFLSNTGGQEINKKCYETWQLGNSRSGIKLSDMEEMLEQVAFNEKSGLKNSGVVERNLIDHFVPFFPLEREHVESCVKDEVRRLNARKLTPSEMQEIMDELQWMPKTVRLYSKSGCKKIAQKVGLV